MKPAPICRFTRSRRLRSTARRSSGPSAAPLALTFTICAASFGRAADVSNPAPASAPATFPAADVSKATRDESIRQVRSWAYSCTAKPDPAVAGALAPWVRANPDDAEAAFWLAESYHERLIPGDRHEREQIELLKRAAAAGFPTARAELGRRYMAGEGVPQDPEHAVTLIRDAVAQEDPYAFLLMGMLANLGAPGIPKDHREAERYFNLSVQHGNLRAYAALAMLKSSQERREEAVADARRGAEAGDGAAQLLLAMWYETGFGVPKDERKSFQWMKRAADTGNARAQRCLGDSYVDGIGTPAEPRKAVPLYEAAAAAGDKLARLRLAECYLEGIGTGINFPEGRRRLDELVAEGYPEAQTMLGIGYARGVWVPRDLAKSRELLTQAADKGVEKAKAYLKVLDDLDRGQ